METYLLTIEEDLTVERFKAWSNALQALSALGGVTLLSIGEVELHEP